MHLTNVLRYGSLSHSNILCIKSTIKSGIPTLGMFTNVYIPNGSLITTYGGEIRHITEFVSIEDKSHAMRLYGNDSHLALCGRRFSQEFNRPHISGVTSRLHSTSMITKDLHKLIMNSGCGYMMNHDTRTQANCRVIHVQPGKLYFERGHHDIPCIVTKRNISINEELTYFYGSWVARNNFFL